MWEFQNERVGSVNMLDFDSYISNHNYVNVWFQLQRFMLEHPNLGTSAKAFTQAVETVRANIEWQHTNLNTVTEWLKQNI